MSAKDQRVPRVVFCEANSARPTAAEQRYAAIVALLERGFAVTQTSGDTKTTPVDQETLVVFGSSRADPKLRAKVDGERPGVRFHDITGLEASQITEVVQAARAATMVGGPGEWKPWFPVIDYDRCTHCLQCLSFCLFGVYGVGLEQKIEVQNAESCKTNCPACSRVCPEAAIIFPKYGSGPINGEALPEGQPAREGMKIDISALLGGDIHGLLRERSERARARFSSERDSHLALQERQKCLARLAEAAGIPPEVLMSLPSAEEIQSKAQEAMAKAKAALSAQNRPPPTAP